MHKNSKTHKLVVSFVAFMTSLLLTVLAFLIVLQVTLFNPDYFMSIIDVSQYGEYLTDEIKENFGFYSESNEFESTDLTAVVQVDTVTSDVKIKVARLYNSNVTDVSVEKFNERLYNNLIKIVNDRGYTVSDETDEAIKKLVDICTANYEEEISLPFESTIASFLNMGNRLYILISAAAIVTILLLFLLNSVAKSTVHKLMYSSFSFYGSALTVVLPMCALMLWNKVGKIGVTSKALYNLVTSYLNGIIICALVIGLIFAAIGVMLNISYVVHKKRIIRENKSHLPDESSMQVLSYERYRK